MVTGIGCTNREQSLKQKRKEVMDIHDEAMAKMDQLYNNELKARKLLADSSNPLKGKDSIRVQKLVYQLVDAQENMMQWMRDYNAEKGMAENPNAEKFLADEFQKVTVVNTDIFSALDSAKAILP